MSATARRPHPDHARPGLRLRQDRPRRPGPRPARGRRRAGLHRLAPPRRIADAGRPGHQGRGAHRLPRVPRRPGQDAAPAGARRASSPTGASTPTSQQLAELGIEPFDLVVVNLYPFARDRRLRRDARRVRRADRHRRPVDGARRGQEPPVGRDRHLARARTPTCSRAVARGRLHPRRSGSGSRPRRSRTPRRTTCAVASWMGNVLTDTSDGTGFPAWIGATWEQAAVLRYGENPHQQAALYVDGRGAGPGPGRAAARQGDVLQQLRRRRRRPPGRATTSTEPAVAIIKHANPCGIAVGADVAEAHRKAHACDPVSAFGGVIAANRPVTVGDGRAGRRDLHRGGRRAGATRTAPSRCWPRKKNIRLLRLRRRRARRDPVEFRADLRRPAAAAASTASTPPATTRRPGRWPPARPPRRRACSPTSRSPGRPAAR